MYYIHILLYFMKKLNTFNINYILFTKYVNFIIIFVDAVVNKPVWKLKKIEHYSIILIKKSFFFLIVKNMYVCFIFKIILRHPQ